MSEKKSRLLLNGLIEGHEHQFNTDPQFRATILGLAELLPLWVEGIAEAGNRTQGQMDRMVELMSKGIVRWDQL